MAINENTLLIGIDLGTTGCKSAIFDSKLNMLADAYIEYPLINLSATWIEQDAALWWDLTKQVVKESLEKSGRDPKDVAGISISSQGIAVVPVDENCNPLRNAISWLDSRPVEQVERLIADHTFEKMFERTGKECNGYYTLPKIMWLMEHEPEICAKTFKYLLPMDFLMAKLCGEYVTDHTMASGTICYDAHVCDWAYDMLEQYNIPVDKLPRLAWAGEKAGTILPAVAKELGMSEDVVIAVGAQDQKVASIAAGMSEGVCTVSLGTASALEMTCDTPVVDPNYSIPTGPYLMPNVWVLEGCVSTCGAALRWFKENVLAQYSYKEIDELAAQADMTQDVFFFPHLSGAENPRPNPAVRGTFMGISLGTTPKELAFSVLSGIAYQIRALMEQLEQVKGVPAEVIKLFGGGSKSKVWGQMIADITNRPVILPITIETGNMGAAMLAGKAIGLFDDLLAAGNAMPRKDTLYPDAAKHELYEAQYHRYVKLQDILIDNVQ